jgi:Diacylglycerol kinase accessory domain
MEVIGITGSFHMGTITAGLSRGIRIAQVADIRLRAKAHVQIPFHVDGEPERLELPPGGVIHCSKWLSGQMLFWHGSYPDLDREHRRHRHHTGESERAMQAEAEEEELFL